MARYTGPKLKKMRGLGVQLPGLSSKPWDERKPYPPGMHLGRHQKKMSIYGQQLKEKQKIRYHYGLQEKQLKRVVNLSFKQKGSPGSNLVTNLERRLDNVVFRAGFARSIPCSRQLVSHKHILLNGKKVNIPSLMVKPGDVVELSDKAKKIPAVAISLNQPALAAPEWLKPELAAGKAEVLDQPSPESVPFPLNIALVVEFYSH